MTDRPPRRIVEPVRVYDTPGSSNGTQPPQPGKLEAIAAKLQSEYVAGGIGGSGQWFANLVRTLPWSIDDVSAEFGDDLYFRMLHDPQIASVVNLFKASIIEDGLELASAVTDADGDGYDQAKAVADAATEMLAELRDPDLDAILWNLLDAIALGNRVAEQVYSLGDLNGKEGLLLTGLRVKPRHMTSFVVDSFMHLLGLVAFIPGVGAPLMQGYLLEPKDTPNLLPRQKFAIYSFRPADNDPRGSSVLRPAFTAWNNKQAIIREHVKYLTQFASPSLIGTTPEQAVQALGLDAEGNYTAPATAALTPEQALADQLASFKNGSVLAVPFGTTVQALFSGEGGGGAFLSAIDGWNQEMVKAILSQTLATEEGEHQARAAASVHQDVVDTIIRQAKRSFVRMVVRDVLRPWVAYNWGDDAARSLTPTASLGHAEAPDLPPLWAAAASLKTSGYLAPSQYQALDEAINLPVRTDDEVDSITAAPPPLPPGMRPGVPGQPTPDARANGSAVFRDYKFGPDEGHWVTIDGEHVLIRGARPGELGKERHPGYEGTPEGLIHPDAVRARFALLDKAAAHESKIAAHDKELARLHDAFKALADESDRHDPNSPEFKAIVNQMVALEEEQAGHIEGKKAHMQEMHDNLHALLHAPTPGRVIPYGMTKGANKIAADSVGMFNKLVDGKVVDGHAVFKLQRGRAHYTPQTHEIAIQSMDGMRIGVHELGHWLEHKAPAVSTLARRFLEHRTKGETPVPLKRLTGMPGYRGDEVAIRDRFVHPYMGKIYTSHTAHVPTEIMSMGLENLTDAASAVWFAKNDPEMFDFIVSTARGLNQQ